MTSEAVNNFGVLGDSRTNLMQGTLSTPAAIWTSPSRARAGSRCRRGGRLYTRNGNFHVDRKGQLVTADGEPVRGRRSDHDSTRQALGQRRRHHFGGRRAGRATAGGEVCPGNRGDRCGRANFQRRQAATGQPGGIVQGSLEGSNVNGVTAAVDLVALQRHADLLQQALTPFTPTSTVLRRRICRGSEELMFRALYTAASGMVAQQLNLDNVANNLSNSSTSGFRRRRLQFQDLIYQNLVMPGSAATQNTTVASGLQIGLGTRTAASEVIQIQGDFNSTGNPLDLAIQGTGFFQVNMPGGQTGYTRAGMFHLDNQGNMVTADGNPLDPPIAIPPDALTITIGTDGTVSVTQPGQTQAQQVGSIHWRPFRIPVDSTA